MLQGTLDIVRQLSNRELAIVIWMMVFILLACCVHSVRAPLFNLIKAFFAWKLTVGYLVMIAYVSLVLFTLRTLGIWRYSSVASILVWFVCVAFVLLFQWERATKAAFFKTAIKENLRLVILVEFIVNLYVLNLFIELLLVPLFVVIAVMIAVAERDAKYETIRKFLNRLMIILGLFIGAYALLKIAIDFKHVATLATLETFLLPIILTLFFLPFVYLVAVFANYENLFKSLDFFIRDKSVRKYAKQKILRAFGLNLSGLNRWRQHIGSLHMVDRQSVNKAINEIGVRP